YSVFSTNDAGLRVELTQTVDRERPVKLSSMRIHNGSAKPRQLRVYAYAEWVLGNNPNRTAPYIVTDQDEETGALLATNRFSAGYCRHAFLACDAPVSGFTTSRRDFIGRFGTISSPAAVQTGAPLGGMTGLDGDPC